VGEDERAEVEELARHDRGFLRANKRTDVEVTLSVRASQRAVIRGDQRTYCRMTLRSDSVSRDDEPLSERYCGEHIIS
jgi:hypothetical protein